MTRVDNIVDSFRKVADMAFDNLPPEIAVYQCVYVRDRKNTSADYPDWETQFVDIIKGATVYDVGAVKELITRSVNNTEPV